MVEKMDDKDLSVVTGGASSIEGMNGPFEYTIKQGDTLSKIANLLGVPMNDLKAWNNIQDENKIYAGSKLVYYYPKNKSKWN